MLKKIEVRNFVRKNRKDMLYVVYSITKVLQNSVYSEQYIARLERISSNSLSRIIFYD